MQFGEFRNTEALNSTFRRIRELGLEQNVFELDTYGFTVVPPDRVAERAFFERVRSTVLRLCSESADAEAIHGAPADGGQERRLTRAPGVRACRTRPRVRPATLRVPRG